MQQAELESKQRLEQKTQQAGLRPRYSSGSRTTPSRAAGPRYVPGRRAALRTGPRAALRTGPRAALHAGPTTAAPHRWIFGPTDRQGRYIPRGEGGGTPLESTAGLMYRTLGLRSAIGFGLLESSSACTCQDLQLYLARDPAGAE